MYTAQVGSTLLGLSRQQRETIPPMKLISKLKKTYRNNPSAIKFQHIRQINKNERLKQRTKYAKMFDDAILEENVILYESHHGGGMNCNPYAIFKELLNNPKYSQLTHIWVVNDSSKVKPQYKTAKNVTIIKHNSKEYFYYLARAKYLISNTTFPQFFIRKPQQVYLNTWHGTPLKTLGKEIKGGMGHHVNWQRNLLQATHIIQPNKFTADYVTKVNDIEGFCKAKILESGYPRQDLTLNSSVSSIKKQLNIDSDKKVVLWAPTWRGSIGRIKTSDVDRFINDYKYMQESLGDNYIILLRVHHLLTEPMEQTGLGNFLVDETIDTNELLAAVDILVTDYSSIAIDFLATGRPLVLYCYDLERYEKSRGLIINPLQLPAPLCKTVKQAIEAIQKAEIDAPLYEGSYRKSQNLFTYLDNGAATQRVIDFVFEGDEDNSYRLDSPKKNLLFYCGAFIPNGVTRSALSLLNNLNSEKYNIAVVLTTADFNKQTSANSEAFKNVSQLKNHIKIYFRSINEMYGTAAEIAERDYSFTHGVFPRGEKIDLLKSVYQREFQRLFGNTHFDVIFDFSGYRPDWISLMAFGSADKKMLYLHSDMLADSKRKTNGRKIFAKAFSINFPLYSYFDKLISVSDLSNEVNKEKLSRKWNVPESKFTYLNNSVDHQFILENAAAEVIAELYGESYYIDHEERGLHSIKMQAIKIPNPSHTHFAIIGRLSPEKGHKRLIHAFQRALELDSNIYLHIIGDGPLRKKLEKIVIKKELEDKVIFTGNLNNPFAYLKLCDCLISASKYEGQGLTLLEALVLEKAIFATETTGSISVLKEGSYGEIVPNSKDGLYGGFGKYLHGEITPKKFDYIKYNQRAIRMFDSLLDGENSS